VCKLSSAVPSRNKLNLTQISVQQDMFGAQPGSAWCSSPLSDARQLWMWSRTAKFLSASTPSPPTTTNAFAPTVPPIRARTQGAGGAPASLQAMWSVSWSNTSARVMRVTACGEESSAERITRLLPSVEVVSRAAWSRSKKIFPRKVMVDRG